MRHSRRYPFTPADHALGNASLRPYLPLTLSFQGRSLETTGFLDTGAAVNVLPYPVGLELGAIWLQQTIPLQLTGNLAHYEARLLLVMATVASFKPVRLAFAWTQADQVPLLLGQTNFFMEFDVCFYRAQQIFEVAPKNQRIAPVH